jgi:hypothetical protein
MVVHLDRESLYGLISRLHVAENKGLYLILAFFVLWFLGVLAMLLAQQ